MILLRLTGPLNDLMAITSLQQVSWGAGEGWLINVFDWDTIIVDENSTVKISYNLDLCTGIRPCSAHIKGSKFGVIYQMENGFFSCLKSHGCSGLVLESVQVVCQKSQAVSSLLTVAGSNVTIVNSSFLACSSEADGGVVHAFDHARVNIRFATFRDIHSSGRGGAISAHRSSLSIVSCNFSNTSAEKGGGAVWASYQSTYDAVETEDMKIIVVSCKFQQCFSNYVGGAIFLIITAAEMNKTVLKTEISESEFFQCFSRSDGGALYSYGSSVVVSVKNSKFTECKAVNTGGAVAATDSNVSVSGSHFLSCSTYGGGGAISVTRLTCVQGETSSDSLLDLQSSTLSLCSSGGFGGAILAFIYSTMNGGIIIQISQSQFDQCSSVTGGGAVHFSGSSVSASIQGSEFRRCVSWNRGGAVSVYFSAKLAVVDSSFEANSAEGLGGGALHLYYAQFSYYNISCKNNVALRGGGGALLWQGLVYPYSSIDCPAGTRKATEFCFLNSETDKYNCSWLTCSPDTRAVTASAQSNAICSSNNAAMYGPCIASDIRQLLVPKATELTYPGFQVSVAVIKKDAYNQTITSDSATSLYLGVVSCNDVSGQGNSPAVLQNGTAVFSKTAIKPVFNRIDLHLGLTSLESEPYVFIVGVDSQTVSGIQSEYVHVALHQGSGVCPAGYILALEKGLSGPGACTLCPQGTYSVNPLANMENSSEIAPACLNCPPGSVSLLL